MTTSSDTAANDDDRPGSVPLGAVPPPVTVRLPGLTHAVVRTMVRHLGKSFTKTYVCGSVEDAERLVRQFEQRSEFIRRVNEAVRGPGADGPVLVLTPYRDNPTEVAGTTRVRTAVDTQALPPEDLPPAPATPDGVRVDSHQVVHVTAGWKDPVAWPVRGSVAAIGMELDRLRDVARALDVIHADNGAHGDVKPANICKDQNGYVLVDPDLLCCASRHDPEDWTVPPTDQATPAYIHPSSGQGGVGRLNDIRANDVFGFVAILACVVLGDDQVIALYTDPQRRRQLEHHVPEAIRVSWHDGAGVDKTAVADLFAGWLGHDRAWFAGADCAELLNSLREALKHHPVLLDPRRRSARAEAVFRTVRQQSGQVHPTAVRGEVRAWALRVRKRATRWTFGVLAGVGVTIAAMAMIAFWA